MTPDAPAVATEQVRRTLAMMDLRQRSVDAALAQPLQALHLAARVQLGAGRTHAGVANLAHHLAAHVQAAGWSVRVGENF